MRVISKLWGIIYCLTLIAFLAIIFYLHLLPNHLMIIAIGVSLIVSLFIFPPLYFKNIKRSRKVIAWFLSLLLIPTFVLGTVYMGFAMHLFDEISGAEGLPMDYYIYARTDYEHDSLADVKEGTIHINGDCPKYKRDGITEAVENLGLDCDEEDDIPTLGTLGISGEAEMVALNSEEKEYMAKISDTFFDDMKQIGVITAKVKSGARSKPAKIGKESFNVLLLGMDTYGPIDKEGRSDVNMIATINPKTKKILLTSIPRDYAINLRDHDDALDKLTHAGLYGAQASAYAVEDLLDIDINYTVKINFTTFVKLIDAIGGIDVDSDIELDEGDYYGDGRLWVIHKGMNHMNGDIALMFARERNSYQEGDLHRNSNQQKVFKSIFDKVTSKKTILTKFITIVNSLKDQIDTNFTSKELQEITFRQLINMGAWSIENQNITGEGNARPLYSAGGAVGYIMDQDEDSINEARDKIISVMNE